MGWGWCEIGEIHLQMGDIAGAEGRPSSDVPLMIWIERDPDIAPPEASDPERIGAAAVAAMGTLLSAGGHIAGANLRLWMAIERSALISMAVKELGAELLEAYA